MPDNSIFSQRAKAPSTPGIPLPERMRPNSLAEFVGQEHLVGPGAVLRKMIESGNISSFILWGPPGVGKTTLAHIVSRELHRDFYTLSAINSGVKDLRDVFARAKDNSIFAKGSPILFIDEIHRFSKSQQDALLGAVETGTVTLIGATTENPSFEVITPLLSRCQVFVMKSLEVKDLEQLLDRALTQDAYLSSRNIEVRERTALFRFSGGDARKLLNIFEIVVNSFPPDAPVIIDDATVADRLQENIAVYDKNGEMHYDIISAFIKSIRGSDPNGAVYWMARMLAGGEDPLFIARLRRRPQDRHARGPHHPLGVRHIPGHLLQEQLRLHGHRRRPGPGQRRRQLPCPPAPAKCPHQTDEGPGLPRRLPLRPRLRGQLHRPGISP